MPLRAFSPHQPAAPPAGDVISPLRVPADGTVTPPSLDLPLPPRRSYDRLFVTLLYVLLYLTILFMQKNKAVLFKARTPAHSPLPSSRASSLMPHPPTLRPTPARPPRTPQVWESVTNLAPVSNSNTMSNPGYALQVNGADDIYGWLQSILFPAWNDPGCGDISCIIPYEFPSFGARSCARRESRGGAAQGSAAARNGSGGWARRAVRPLLTSPLRPFLPAPARSQATRGASRTAACSRTSPPST